MVNGRPLFQGQNSDEQIFQIMNILGKPGADMWPMVNELPPERIEDCPPFPNKEIRKSLPSLDDNGFDLFIVPFFLFLNILTY